MLLTLAAIGTLAVVVAAVVAWICVDDRRMARRAALIARPPAA